MMLVLDTNILFSFFRDNPVRRAILKAESYSLELFSSEYAIDELKKKMKKLVKYSRLSEEEVLFSLKRLEKHVKFIPEVEYKKFELKAKQFSPHDKDLPFFSLALKLNCAIWSNEPGFKEQSGVEIFNTQDIKDEFNIV